MVFANKQSVKVPFNVATLWRGSFCYGHEARNRSDSRQTVLESVPQSDLIESSRFSRVTRKEQLRKILIKMWSYVSDEQQGRAKRFLDSSKAKNSFRQGFSIRYSYPNNRYLFLIWKLFIFLFDNLNLIIFLNSFIRNFRKKGVKWVLGT